MMKRFATLAALTVAALSFAGQADAAYTLTLTNLLPNPMTFTSNGVQFDFAIAGTPQNSAGNVATPFNVINVANPVNPGTGNGSTTVSVDFRIQGNDAATPGLFTGTLTGTFSVTNAVSNFTNISIANQTGSGFTVGDFQYARPSVGSSFTGPSGTLGNISFVVTPTAAVPEPTSVAVLGLGLAGLSVVSFFRRRRHA